MADKKLEFVEAQAHDFSNSDDDVFSRASTLAAMAADTQVHDAGQVQGNAGGMRRAVPRVEVRGAAIVVTPHSPVLRRLRERRADLASPETDPAAWVAGVVWEAEGVLHSAVEARLWTSARTTPASRP